MPIHRRFLVAILSVLVFSLDTSAQLDSLKETLNLDLSDSARSKVYYLMSRELDRNDPSQSREYAEKALEILNALPEERALGKAMCIKLIGNTYKNQGEYDMALEKYLSAITWIERTDVRADLAPIYNDIGVVHKIMHEYDKALPYYRLSNKVCREVGNEKGVVMTLNNIGTIYDALGMIDSAKLAYMESLLLAKKIQNYRAIAISTNNLGELAAKAEDRETAIKYFKETLFYDRKTNDTYGMTFSMLNLGNTYREQGDAVNMKIYLDSTLILAEEMGLKGIMKNVYQSYSYYYQQTKDFEQSLTYYTLYTQFKDSIYNEQRMAKFDELETKYETEKKEREIANLSRKQVEDALALSQQRNWIIGLTAGVLLILIGGGFLVYRRRKRAQATLAAERLSFQKRLIDSTVEAEEKERQRIAKDLHDGLVQSLAALKLGVQNAMNTIGLNDDQKGSFQDHIQNIDTAAEEARSISHQMMPRALTETGLVSAMEDMLYKTLRHTKIEYNLETFGINDERFKPSIEIGLYRICQELVNNILKHSEAKHVEIQLLKTKTHLVLHVEDDGKGFVFDQEKAREGIGLNNIFSRASSVNGEVNYEKGKPGTIANIRVPLS